MNTISKEIQKERAKVRNTLSKSIERCQVLIWQIERDGLKGQERIESEQALRLIEHMKCADRLLDMT
jgi:hypothetical protein